MNKTQAIKRQEPKFCSDMEELLDNLPLKDGITVSFHHHLRNGDYVLPMIMKALAKRGLKDITVAASSLFPCHECLVPMMEKEIVTKIHTDYMQGPVAQAVSRGLLKHPAHITTHGGRPREILEGELEIDIAFLAAPCVDKKGNATGSEGKSNCGVLGYAIADAEKAKVVVLITDQLVEKVDVPEIYADQVDYIFTVPAVGDPAGIVSGTTRITKDPVGLVVAQKAIELLKTLGFLKEGLSFQTGAGGISLAVAQYLREDMIKRNYRGSFASGGITDYLVQMLEEGFFEELYDVQCFTEKATRSIRENPRHKKMSAHTYANPHNPQAIVNRLDVVILGASEIDLAMNVNVTTASDGTILGGSGGHADTAAGAKFSVIVSKLINSRISVVKDNVTTVTTPGKSIDCLVTDRGIVIHPKHEALIARAKKNPRLEILTMEEIYQRALVITGKPKTLGRGKRVVARSISREGKLLDEIYQVLE